MTQPFEEIVEQYRQKAFAIAESASPAYVAKLSALIQNAIETGATVDELRSAIKRLDNTEQATEFTHPWSCRCRKLTPEQQYNQRVTELSGKIVALIKAELPEEYGSELAIDAALLAQHQLFGRTHMWRLFTGNLS